MEDPDVDDFCKKLNDKKYKHARPGVEEMPWGTRDMTLKDPFGNKLIFYKNV
ncbi:MAG: glyoxalase superfamily protein [Methyloligellaceae bacterium]